LDGSTLGLGDIGLELERGLTAINARVAIIAEASARACAIPISGTCLGALTAFIDSHVVAARGPSIDSNMPDVTSRIGDGQGEVHALSTVTVVERRSCGPSRSLDVKIAITRACLGHSDDDVVNSVAGISVVVPGVGGNISIVNLTIIQWVDSVLAVISIVARVASASVSSIAASSLGALIEASISAVDEQ